MKIYLLLNLYIFLQAVPYSLEQPEDPGNYDRVKLHNELNRELRNAMCCINHMRCCKKKRNVAEIEIRAVLVRCPNAVCDESGVSKQTPGCSLREGKDEHNRKNASGFKEDNFFAQTIIKKCRKKLLLTIKITGSSFDPLNNEFMVVDHVYDPVTRKNTRLLTPYVIKLKQEPTMQIYQLKFLHVVNSRATEQVYNKDDDNYTGCDTTSSKPTCGTITYKNKMLPYSQGFCCSCDVLKNNKRQPESLTEYTEKVIRYNDPAFLLDGVECPRNLRGSENINQAEDLIGFRRNDSEEEQIQEKGAFQKVLSKTIPVVYMKAPNKHKYAYKTKLCKKDTKIVAGYGRHSNDSAETYLSALTDFVKDESGDELTKQIESLEAFLNAKNRQTRPKRQMLSNGAQRRGGQNCADKHTPKTLNPETYHESTHCLRFSQVWYTVYHLQPPAIEHSVVFQIFEMHEDVNGRTTWRDMTRGKMIRVGTIQPRYVDEKVGISIKYTSKSQTVDPISFSLNYKSALLLVPEGLKKSDFDRHQELKGGPPEYLIVHASQISLDGDQCNVAGVGFEAFVKQPNRCSRPRGTCLANQPYDLWKHDSEAQKLGKKGCFFLKHYGNLPKDPIRRNSQTGNQYLVMEYSGQYSSRVDMEIKADFNTVLKPQSSATITEVYVDSTSPSSTILTVKISNSGLTSSSFMARLTDCPLAMPASFNNILSKPVLIPPQHQHIFHLKIKCPLPADRFHCSVEALNCKGQLVALRRIRLQKFDRCICTWHCLCACARSSEGLKCIPMSLQHYHAAGFQGSLPVTTYIVHYTLLDDILSLILHTLLFVAVIQLTLGFGKAAIGLYYPFVGFWGLDAILDLPKPMKRYYERDLVERKVHYDEEGWPIHPDTQTKVRSISQPTQFCTNVIFFFAYPCNVAILLVKRVCCPQYIYQNDSVEDDTWDPTDCDINRCRQMASTDVNEEKSLTDSLRRRSDSAGEESISSTTSEEELTDSTTVPVVQDVDESESSDSAKDDTNNSQNPSTNNSQSPSTTEIEEQTSEPTKGSTDEETETDVVEP